MSLGRAAARQQSFQHPDPDPPQQILEHCSSVYGVELDGSQTKAELVEQATALAQQPVEQQLSDLLLDDPLI